MARVNYLIVFVVCIAFVSGAPWSSKANKRGHLQRKELDNFVSKLGMYLRSQKQARGDVLSEVCGNAGASAAAREICDAAKSLHQVNRDYLNLMQTIGTVCQNAGVFVGAEKLCKFVAKPGKSPKQMMGKICGDKDLSAAIPDVCLLFNNVKNIEGANQKLLEATVVRHCESADDDDVSRLCDALQGADNDDDDDDEDWDDDRK